MKPWIEGRRVLAAFSDPAGAKFVLSIAALYGECAKSITVISDREYSFYRDFGVEVFSDEKLSFNEWLIEQDILITGTSLPARLELGLIAEANKIGLPSIGFVDHWINIAARFRLGGTEILPSLIGVVNEDALKIASIEGLPASRLSVIGNPYHTFLGNWKPKISRAELINSLGPTISYPYLLYLPEPISRFGLKTKYGFDEVDGLNVIRQARRSLAGQRFSLVVKGHPNQDHHILTADMIKNNDPEAIYLSDGDVITLSFYAHAVIGFFSNALIEASILGVQVIRPLVYLKREANDPLSWYSMNKFVDTFSFHEFTRAISNNIAQHTK